jgi:uncharacterized secreted protein with C-terminal beta-propeller domain
MTLQKASKIDLRYFAAFGLVLVLIISGSLLYILKNKVSNPDPVNPDTNSNTNPNINALTGTTPALAFSQFKSCSELLQNIEDYSLSNQGKNTVNTTGAMPMMKDSSFAMNSLTGGGGQPEFSGTNNQVENVDEGDIVKTDGKYIYTVNGRNINITSVDSQTGQLQKVSKISLVKSISSVQELNLYQNNLIVNGYGNSNNRNQSVIQIYDIQDPKTPALIRDIAVDGDIQTTRMVDGVVYLVNNFYNYESEQANITQETTQETTQRLDKLQSNLPKIYDSVNSNQPQNLLECDKIKYVKPIQNLNFVTVLAVDLKSPKSNLGREVIMGSSQNVYASENNLYLALSNNRYYSYNQPEKTNIFKFKLDRTDLAERTKVSFQTQGEVKGGVLNQFSMDEFEGNLRIATHSQSKYLDTGVFNSILPIAPISSTPTPESNDLFVLDESLKQIGAVSNIAPNEQIYSVRFIGKKAYMVTFKQTDPLFAFDLSDPKNPKIAGQLKIPGYSNYLHPISENLIIGIGKDAIAATDSFGDSTDFSLVQGVKLGLFDISDLSNPKEIGKVEIGNRGTDSEALYNHKALLWDARNNLLTIPVTLNLISEEQKTQAIQDGQNVNSLYGEFKYQGSYVYEVNPNTGFKLRGRVSHLETKASPTSIDTPPTQKYDEFGQIIPNSQSEPSKIPAVQLYPNSYNNYNDSLYYINRQYYINNFLITVSPKQIQSNNISDLKFVSNIGI